MTSLTHHTRRLVAVTVTTVALVGAVGTAAVASTPNTPAPASGSVSVPATTAALAGHRAGQ